MEELEAEKDNPQFCCPNCSSKPEMVTKENYEKIFLHSGNNFTCLQCKSEYKEKELLSRFKKHSKTLESAERLIEKGSSLEILGSLKTASTFFQNNLIPPSYHHVQCQGLLEKVYQSSLFDVYD